MVINTNGKRKTAKARATLKEDGNGKVRVNNRPLSAWTRTTKLRIQEPLKIAGELTEDVDIKVKVNGGGIQSQAEAVRMAIARALAEHSDGSELREKYLEYDRHMLVEDYRRTETRKPSQSSKGARHKQQKSYR